MDTNSTNPEDYLKATFWERVAAVILDELILLIPSLLLQLLFSKLFPTLSKFSFILNSLIFISYNVYLLHHLGATIGKRAMKIRVVSESYQKVTLGKIILRETVSKWISNIFFNLGNLWVLIDKNHQGWHDKIAKTFVVKLDDTGQPIAGSNLPVTRKDKAFFALLLLIWGIPFVILPMFVFFYLFIGMPHQVKGSAMEPNLKNNEYILTSKIAYKLGKPQRGDIIVFKSPKTTEVDYIKRIVGLPGDQLSIANGKVYMNGKELKESYLPPNTITNLYPGSYLTEGTPILIPPKNYFTLGDNRSHSVDSRDFGPVPSENIIGKYLFIYWKGKDN